MSFPSQFLLLRFVVVLPKIKLAFHIPTNIISATHHKCNTEATKDGIATVYKGLTKESKQPRSKGTISVKRGHIIDYVLKWRNIRVIVCTIDLAILKPMLYELCDFLLVEESKQSKHLQALIIASQMAIKTLFLVGDIELIPP